MDKLYLENPGESFSWKKLVQVTFVLFNKQQKITSIVTFAPPEKDCLKSFRNYLKT